MAAIVFHSSSVFAFPGKIVAGEMILGGSSYDTPNYQTYIRFSLTAQNRMPRREYRMTAEQAFSVYLNHPIQPNGNYEYDLVMPYGPQSLLINNVLFAPVWFEDCSWQITGFAQTPEANANSPQFVFVNSTFTMRGRSVFFGANNSAFKTGGSGNLELKFEKINNKYYFLQARYIFSENTGKNKESAKLHFNSF